MVGIRPFPREAVVQSLTTYEQLVRSSKRAEEGARKNVLKAAFEIREMIAYATDENLKRWLEMLESCEQDFTEDDFGPLGLSRGTAQNLSECISAIRDEAQKQ